MSHCAFRRSLAPRSGFNGFAPIALRGDSGGWLGAFAFYATQSRGDRLKGMSKPWTGVLALVVLVIVAGCTDDPPKSAALPQIHFVSPDPDSNLTGLADLKLESTLLDSAAHTDLQLDGNTIDSFSTLMTALRLDTTDFPDGKHQLGIEVETESGERYSDRLDITIENPQHRLVRAIQNKRGYGRGEQVVVELQYTEPGLKLAADLSTVDPSFTSNNVEFEEMGNGKYELRYRIGDSNDKAPGRYEFPVTSLGADGVPLKSLITLQFLGAPRLPLVIDAPDAVFADQAPELDVDANAPRLQVVQAPGLMSEGASDTITVSWTAPEDNPADRVVVRSRTTSGAWVVPLAAPSTSGSLVLPATISSHLSRPTPGLLDLSFSAVGVSGAITEWVEKEVRVIMTSQNDMRVMLSWEGDADLDLAVISPDSTRVDYDHPAGQGGTFELDSNALCERSPVPLESISWPVKATAPGEYKIEVSMFDACGQGTVDYQLLIYACGQIKRISRSLAAGPGKVTQVQPLEPFVVDCMRRMNGRVVYDKGSPGSPDALPAVQVPVRVQGTRESEPPSTVTDGDGYYDISFPVRAGANVQLEVEAAWMPAGSTTPRTKVVGLQGDRIASAISSVGALTDEVTRHNAVITVADGSGAFNILEMMRRSYSWVGSHFDSATVALVKDIIVRWEPGKTPPGGGTFSSPVSASSKKKGQIWISGGANDPDEFDDSATTHEFSHCFAANLGIDDSPGGLHHFTDRVAPAMAWSEGLAAALGQEILGTPDIWYEGTSTRSWINIERTTGDASGHSAFGTTDTHHMNGRVNEFLVGAVLWDLLDPLADGNDVDNDRISCTGPSVYAVLSRYLSSKERVNRGGEGRDLVDFLDGWRCFEGQRAARIGVQPPYSELDDLLKGRSFAYTPPTAPISCQ